MQGIKLPQKSVQFNYVKSNYLNCTLVISKNSNSKCKKSLYRERSFYIIGLLFDTAERNLLTAMFKVLLINIV